MPPRKTKPTKTKPDTKATLARLGLADAVRFAPRGAFDADTSAAECYVHVRRGLLVSVCPLDGMAPERLKAQEAVLYAAGEERNQHVVGLDVGIAAWVIGREAARALVGDKTGEDGDEEGP